MGNQLVVFCDDNSRTIAYPSNGIWLARNNGIGGNGETGGDGGGTLTVISPLPTSFTGTTADGDTITIGETQVLRMAQTIMYGSAINGVDEQACLVAGIAAMTESSLRNLSNTSTYPDTATLPDIDGDGGDNDSCGIWQMRPASGWGTPEECCNIRYEITAFFGGPTGPNGGSPMGLLDHTGWENLDPGEAAQAVEVSAFPDRYQNYIPFITALMNAIIAP
jgi:hypothetical protein